MTTVGTGKYRYEFIQDFPKLPAGQSFGIVSTVATDSQDRVYVFQRTDHPVAVFDRDGNYLTSWGIGAITDPHGLSIADDIVYLTDRSDCVAMTFTLEGKPLQVIGKRGVPSETGCDKPGGVVPHAAGPFNYPTEMVSSPSGEIYVSDGYQNARVHRFTGDGQLINSWGEPGTAPGQFHLPHSVMAAPDGKVYVCDRTNRRVQIFSADGEFITMWTGMGGPNDIVLDKDGAFYLCEQAADGQPPRLSIRDADGKVMAQWPIRHTHGLWVDSRGDIYLGLTTSHSVDKYVRAG